MNKKFYYRLGNYILLGLLIAIILCSFVQWYQTSVFDNRPVTITTQLDSDFVGVTFQGITEKTNIWEVELQQSEDPEDVKIFKGATVSTKVENRQNHSIRDWTFRQEVETECYLNGFWCGTYEIHQFRDGKEIVEEVDMENNDLSAMTLEVSTYSKDMMIHLLPGDYLVYHPSKEVKEDVIAGNGVVNVGANIYFEDRLELSTYSVTYYNERSFNDGALYDVIVIMTIFFFIFAALYLVSFFTYRKTRKEVESLTHSVISGLSLEYKSLWLINIKNKSINLVRNHDDEEIQNAVDIAKEFGDYETAINHYINHYVDRKDRERVRKEVSFDEILKHLSKENFYTVNYLHHPYNEECSYFQMTFTMANYNGNEENIILAYRDIDKLVKEEQAKQHQLEQALLEAEEANKSKSVFLANMSHEIRTPINAILGMDTMILRESKEEPVKAYAKDIKNASNTLLSLINDILDFSKIESGKMELVPVQYRLDSVINDLMNMIKPKAEEKGLVLVLNLNPNTPAKLFGDEIRVKQIILNLLTNAVKYTHEGTVEWVVDYEETKPDICRLKVSVKDTGIGIKDEDMERIASPYQRLDESINRSVEGTGLGLNISINLLKKMGSALKIESVYGEGSTFSFELEQSMWGTENVGAHLNDTYDVEEMPEKFHSPLAKVLVVDDVEMNLIVVKGLLKRIQITPDMCTSGIEACEMAKNNQYDLILLDAMMPKLSGEETLHKIREDSEYNKTTPIIVLTANAVIGAKEEYLVAGFTDYLSKPIDGELLEDMIESYLPKEKIIYPDQNGFETTSDKGSKLEDSNKYIEKLKALAYINVNAGIDATGGVDTYITICSNFYETANARIQMIKDCYDAKDYKNYAIQTHALKSSARLIGAEELSELAFVLEQAGKQGDEKTIIENNAHLIELYENVQCGLRNAFSEIDREVEKKNPKKDITEKKLKRKLRDLKELIEAFDYESAKQLFDSLKGYNLPDSFSEVYNRLKYYMAEVDSDSIISEIIKYVDNGR